MILHVAAPSTSDFRCFCMHPWLSIPFNKQKLLFHRTEAFMYIHAILESFKTCFLAQSAYIVFRFSLNGPLMLTSKGFYFSRELKFGDSKRRITFWHSNSPVFKKALLWWTVQRAQYRRRDRHSLSHVSWLTLVRVAKGTVISSKLQICLKNLTMIFGWRLED